MTANSSEFWRQHPGLVWSNPQADDSVRIRAALLQPRFHLLLDVAVQFGLPRLRTEWESLQPDNTVAVKRARPVVERILRHIEEGFACVDSGN